MLTANEIVELTRQQDLIDKKNRQYDVDYLLEETSETLIYAKTKTNPAEKKKQIIYAASVLHCLIDRLK